MAKKGFDFFSGIDTVDMGIDRYPELRLYRGKHLVKIKKVKAWVSQQNKKPMVLAELEVIKSNSSEVLAESTYSALQKRMDEYPQFFLRFCKSLVSAALGVGVDDISQADVESVFFAEDGAAAKELKDIAIVAEVFPNTKKEGVNNIKFLPASAWDSTAEDKASPF